MVVTPREFLETVVRPNLAEFNADYGDVRRAYNAVAAIDALAAHIYVWCKENDPSGIADLNDDSHYRERLARYSSDFRLLCDIAKAQKHVHLGRGKPVVTTSAQVTARSIGWGEARWVRVVGVVHVKWWLPPTTKSFATSSKSRLPRLRCWKQR